jgi:hypothetical protein
MSEKVETHGLDDLIEKYLDEGKSIDDVVKEVVEVLDALIPLDAFGPVGQILEALDGPAILLIVKAIIAARGTPDERAIRRAKREERKLARRLRREEKKLLRLEELKIKQ